MHKNVHLKEFCLQLHLLLEQGDWDLQPHFTNLIRAGGAMSVPSGVTTGNKKSNPSGICHPYWSGLRLGGSESKGAFHYSSREMSSKNVFFERCISRGEGTQFRRFKGIACHFSFPWYNSCFRQGAALAQAIVAERGIRSCFLDKANIICAIPKNFKLADDFFVVFWNEMINNINSYSSVIDPWFDGCHWLDNCVLNLIINIAHHFWE